MQSCHPFRLLLFPLPYETDAYGAPSISVPRFFLRRQRGAPHSTLLPLRGQRFAPDGRIQAPYPGRQRAVAIQLQPAITRRGRVELVPAVTNGELEAGGRRGQHAHVVAPAVEGLVHMAP